MAQPKHVSAYGIEHLEVLMAATLGRKRILFPIKDEEDGEQNARRKATAFVHRTNGLKRALVAEKHSLATECSNVRVRMPKRTDDGWMVEMERAHLWGEDMILLDDGPGPSAKAQGAQTPDARRTYSTPELDFNAILSDGEI